MTVSAIPEDEGIRLHGPGPCGVPHTETDERLDALTRLARRHFGVSAALLALVDAQGQPRLSSCQGLPLRQMPRDVSLFLPAIFGEGLLLVADTLRDERFRTHPVVVDHPWMRFHAGYPLIAADGSRLGALCLLDERPRELDGAQRQCLSDLARMAADVVERHRADARRQAQFDALQDSETRMALAIAGSGTGVWDRNVVTGDIHYSSGWKAMLGYAEHELTTRIEESYTRVHPDDLAYVQATIQAHFEQQTESYEVEHRIRCKDGSYKWICSRGKVVSRDQSGRPLRMIGTTTDITAMRAMSARLQQTVDLVTSLTNEVPGLVFQYRRMPDGESFFSYASTGIEDIYELTPQQVAGGTAAIDAILHPEDRDMYHASLQYSAAGLTPWHLEYRVCLPRQGVRWRQGDARPQRLHDGGTLWHGFITDITERKRTEAELREFATIDLVTRLANRRHFMAQIEAESLRIRHGERGTAAVLMCDLDHFKAVNDQWGHAVGDLALGHFAALLREQLRQDDIAGRIGGEEFAVVLRCADLDAAVDFGRRLQQRIAQRPLVTRGQRIALTVSVGIALMTSFDAGADSALTRSDMALYRAKAGGRDRIECH